MHSFSDHQYALSHASSIAQNGFGLLLRFFVEMKRPRCDLAPTYHRREAGLTGNQRAACIEYSRDAPSSLARQRDLGTLRPQTGNDCVRPACEIGAHSADNFGTHEPIARRECRADCPGEQ